MFSTMQDEPLSLAHLLDHAGEAYHASTMSTWTGTETRRATYADLVGRAARVANALVSLGVGRFDRVATFMWNNNEHMEIYTAVPAMGAVLHALNIRLSAGQLTFIANHAEDHVVFVDGSLLATLEAVLPQMRTVRHVVVVNGDASSFAAPPGVAVHDYEELLAAQAATYDFPVLDERAPAAMCYTSGTTGDPKGVVYSHRSLYLHALQVTTPSGFGISTADSCLAIVPMFHVNSWSLPFAALVSGASLLLPDQYLQAEPLLAFMAAERPTRAAAVPAVWNGILTQLERHPQDISHLRTAVVGGAAVPPALMEAFEERHGVTIVQAWGMTETSSLGTVAYAPAGIDADAAMAYRVTQGQFPSLVRHRLVDEDGHTVPHDGISLGEVQVRGPWVTGSYYSPQGPVAEPGSFDDGWLRTGDVGRITRDGYLTLVDRAKDIIKSGGEWISSVEMENDVMAHPDVVEAAVFAVPDPRWDERPCVAVVLREGVTPDPEGLRAHLARRWARWQLPAQWTFVAEVPKTSVGKFDKKVLRSRHADGRLDIVHTQGIQVADR
ncbi:MAG: long-chain fatty acid--CoA ligase [Nocardioides sp.]|uniref:long-chain fatty acid--CoA ligase n=1 Tax=Nocardioides sp. TaxID=35761 RepID=UPI0039E43390